MVYLTCFLIVLSCFTVAHAKYVVAHFMVGNTYPYSVADWSRSDLFPNFVLFNVLFTMPLDIELAADKGLDGFVLNLGRDSWQPDRVADAFAAARDFGSDFKLFLSFDMTSLPCASPSDAEALMRYIINYYGHPNSLFYNGKMFVSTFAGQDCRFGESSLDDGWIKAVKSGPPVYFVPSFFVDPSAFNDIRVMDGAFNVGC
jgi:glucan endo-1,3-alpha-glucosidase